jgi:unsaturated chondroitin disaccharide hydrolase
MVSCALGISLLIVVTAPNAHGQCTTQALQLAQQQLNKTLAYIDASHFPQYTVLNSQNTYSSWNSLAGTEWSSGFLPGWIWYMYEQTLDGSLLSRAQAQTSSLSSEATDASGHDIGFRIMTSYGNGYRITRDPAYMSTIQTAAQTMSTLYVSFPGGGGTINSWPYYSSKTNVIIDNMMTIELLFYAAQNGGNPTWYNMAVNHALNTMQNNVRPDGSTYQGVEYNSDGSVYQYFTADGYSTSSTWSRGQAWGLAGFTMAYRYTGDARFLTTAQNLANYFIAHLPSDYVPYWDFSQTNTYKDSSAAAIAAAGLLELSTYVPDPTKSTYYNSAMAIQNSLSSNYYQGNLQYTDGILLHGTYSVPYNVGIDTSLIWATTTSSKAAIGP